MKAIVIAFALGLAAAADAASDNTPCRIEKIDGVLYLDSPDRPNLAQGDLPKEIPDPCLGRVRRDDASTAGARTGDSNRSDADDESVDNCTDAGTMHADRTDYQFKLGKSLYLTLGWGSQGFGLQHETATLIGGTAKPAVLLLSSSRADGSLLVSASAGGTAIGIVLPDVDEEKMARGDWGLAVGGKSYGPNGLRARDSFALHPGPCNFYSYSPPIQRRGQQQLSSDRVVWFDIVGGRFELRRRWAQSRRGQ